MFGFDEGQAAASWHRARGHLRGEAAVAVLRPRTCRPSDGLMAIPFEDPAKRRKPLGRPQARGIRTRSNAPTGQPAQECRRGPADHSRVRDRPVLQSRIRTPPTLGTRARSSCPLIIGFESVSRASLAIPPPVIGRKRDNRECDDEYSDSDNSQNCRHRQVLESEFSTASNFQSLRRCENAAPAVSGEALCNSLLPPRGPAAVSGSDLY